VALDNCHPFRYGRWLFAHNGSVNRDWLLQRLEARRHDWLQGQTDSEVYFHWILQNLERADSVGEGVAAAVKELDSFTGLNFILTDGTTLFAYRNAAKDHAHYSLFSLRRDKQPPTHETLRSTQLQAELRAQPSRAEKAVLVCSEKLTDEAWEEIPLGNLLIVAEDLSSRLVEIQSPLAMDSGRGDSLAS
jgi:glutamine amidotransferase